MAVECVAVESLAVESLAVECVTVSVECLAVEYLAVECLAAGGNDEPWAPAPTARRDGQLNKSLGEDHGPTTVDSRC